MNNTNITYNNLIGQDVNGKEVNYKRYLKRLLTENFPGVVFSRPPCRRQSERICNKPYQERAIDEDLNIPEDYATICD